MTTLQDRLRQVRTLADEGRTLGLVIPELASNAEDGRIDVAVIGEKKRGKSTFLNALMGAPVFPSRATVCTAAVTILQDAPAPALRVVYRDGRSPAVTAPTDATALYAGVVDAVAVPRTDKKTGQTTGNPDAMHVERVEIGFPNRFATDGVRLIDTPGVNDPDTWREEITFTILGSGRVDAVIMLLDPAQPFSETDRHFLTTQVQNRVKEQILFVVNKIDGVSLADREKSVERIRRLAAELVPNPRVFPLSAKEAFAAQQEGSAIPSDWTAFTGSLDRFLQAGRAGAILADRVVMIRQVADTAIATAQYRLKALASDDAVARADLGRVQAELAQAQSRAKTLDQRMQQRSTQWARESLATLRTSLNELRQAAQDAQQVGSVIHAAQRDLADLMESHARQVAEELHAAFAPEVLAACGDVGIPIPDITLPRFGLPDYVGALPPQDPPPASRGASGGGAAAGAAAGIFFGPLGVLVGGFLGHMLEDNEAQQRTAQAQAAWQRANAQAMTDVRAYLDAIDREIEIISQRLVAAATKQTARVLRAPLDQAIGATQVRVEATRRDLDSGTAERASRSQALQADIRRLQAFHAKAQHHHHSLISLQPSL